MLCNSHDSNRGKVWLQAIKDEILGKDESDDEDEDGDDEGGESGSEEEEEEQAQQNMAIQVRHCLSLGTGAVQELGQLLVIEHRDTIGIRAIACH